MLVRLLYASRAANPADVSATDAILAQSRSHNPSCGITGILCYGGGIFLQALEGGRALRGNQRAQLWRLDHGRGEHRQAQHLDLAEIFGKTGARSVFRVGPGLHGPA